MMTLFTVLVLSYLVGSIPTSIIAGRIARGIDIRQYGSGNAGATNVYRVLGFRLALVVFLIDVGKAAATVVFVTRLRIDPLPSSLSLLQILAGLAVVVGNVWPVFAGFSGGKGVTTSAGVLFALVPEAAGCAAAVWLAVVCSTKYVSLGSISASVTLPAVIVFQKVVLRQPIPTEMLILTLCIPAMIIAAHRSNIQRLLSGTERRIGPHTKGVDAPRR